VDGLLSGKDTTLVVPKERKNYWVLALGRSSHAKGGTLSTTCGTTEVVPLPGIQLSNDLLDITPEQFPLLNCV
jgi:hypothetical protein